MFFLRVRMKFRGGFVTLLRSERASLMADLVEGWLRIGSGLV